MTDTRDPAHLTAARRLRDVADAYDALDERMHHGVERVGGDRARPEVEEWVVTAKMPRSPAPADLQAVTVRMEIAGWATWLARAVLDAHDETGLSVTLPSDPADLLREIAASHLGVFLADPLEAEDFLEAAGKHVRRACGTAWPTGERWLRLGVPCPEYGTSPMGERIPCGGEYRMWMRPDQDVLGDMVCDQDHTHAITPAEWQRAYRRRGKAMDATGVAQLVRTLRLAGGSVA